MAMRKRTELVRALSDLKETDYSKDPELNRMYHRLSKGREQFSEVFDNNIKAVMQISSLDLTMQHQTERIIDIARSVTRATETIFGSSSMDGQSGNQHEQLTNTIIEVSGATDEVYRKIEESQEELTTIKELSDRTIDVSRELRTNMDALLQTIDNISNVIAGINTISMQTNLLALNASIEAARAGAAGKGFAVVAEEIRELAEETQKLTGNMSEFVEEIKEASQKSTQSASGTIKSLDTMTEKINNAWELNDENKQRVSQVNSSVSSIASVSQQLTSSMTQMQTQLKDSTAFMNQVGRDLKEAVEPVVDIEETLDNTVKQMGAMTNDAFYHLKNHEFAKYIENAISAHRMWLNNLKKMVEKRTITPLQLDSSKCGFGHFYYAMSPKIPEIVPIWSGLDAKHKRFHKFGEQVIDALSNGAYYEAEKLCREAEEYSEGLIQDLEKIADIAKA